MFDVAILGTGITGTILGAILARNGVRTLLVEKGVHPRFAIGESTVPETTIQFRVLAARYGVPELAHLSTFHRLVKNVGTTSGVKRNFSFVFHRPGEPWRPTESTQIMTLQHPLGPDVHLYRQDVDAYMLAVASSYGATVRQNTDVTDISFGANGVKLRSRGGATFEASFIIDAGGIKAPVADSQGLRERVPTLRTNSRSIYTHMVGVEPFDAVIDPPGAHGLSTPLSQGTLHHLFHGGWMWVIPFDNHAGSTNRLCSVGLNLDPRVHPPTGLPPEEEFRQFIGQYPAMQKQFARAVPIRDWISTDRLQFSSTRLVGDRYCLMPHAFTFVDPLFSSGLGISLGAINGLGWRLIEAKKTGNWSAEHFAPVERRVKRDFGYFDRLVSRSYLAFSNFNLWNAWHKLWAIASLYGAAGTLDVLGGYYRTGSASAFMRFEEEPYDGIQAHRMPMLAATFDAACREMDTYQEGGQSVETTVSHLFNLVSKSGLWPEPWGTPDRRQLGNFTLTEFIRMMAWVRTKAPEYVRTRYFQQLQFREAAQMLGPELIGDLGRMWRPGRAPAADWRYA